jgi:hypothetical protein
MKKPPMHPDDEFPNTTYVGDINAVRYSGKPGLLDLWPWFTGKHPDRATVAKLDREYDGFLRGLGFVALCFLILFVVAWVLIALFGG